jgi:hypothetical protein
MALECIFSLVLFPLGVFVFKALTDPNSDYGAAAIGCIAGFALGAGLLFYFIGFGKNISTGYMIIAAAIAGTLTGAAAGALWTIFQDRRLLKGTLLGSLGGAVAAPVGIIFLFPLISLLTVD